MKRLKTILTLGLVLLISVGINAQTSKQKKIIKDAEAAKTTLIEKDNGLKKFFSNAAGYVIFPNVGKGGLIVGGASGNGAVYDHGKLVGMADLKKINIGLQAGGQAFIEVIFFETAKELKNFQESNYEFSADASAVALKSGVSVNAEYKNGVAVFTSPKAGLMADASVGGQKFTYNAL
jgi:lipid-binding SYLF domain-containing protein